MNIALRSGLDGTDLSDEDMQRLARWTNLSETTFVLPPTMPEADYRLRIFTPQGELPFAGHPTLGSARAWMEGGGTPQHADRIVPAGLCHQPVSSKWYSRGPLKRWCRMPLVAHSKLTPASCWGQASRSGTVSRAGRIRSPARTKPPDQRPYR